MKRKSGVAQTQKKNRKTLSVVERFGSVFAGLKRRLARVQVVLFFMKVYYTQQGNS